ncbi:C40 family peptidase [Sedimentitalea todarodis]|uniref:NlpC/P60 family protein n=1 Tax=Sedimentitalea todarodis TaxID=1631240 RepID=A0ABU3VAH3_9RHOB|nr:NlpC/P60 family protein [Sedimentitalea todarodis]MDU9003171.1 NlpC/P60 family protein [Sedimentitalea todarodis]
MSDPRLTPANDRVAAAHLTGVAAGLSRVAGTPCQVARPVVDLLHTPDRARERQLLWGERVDLYEDRAGTSFVQAQKDGYVGYVDSAALRPPEPVTHWVSAPACHLYQDANIKSPDLHLLSFGSLVCVLDETDRLAETPSGFIPRTHLRPLGDTMDDPVTVAELFLGTPYLWGGNSRAGIDCSGLVQAALLACGQDCPGDTDQQQSALGREAAQDGTCKRGDLLYWRGHVAMVVDADRLIHANGTHMSVVYEPIKAAIDRIERQGQGPVIAHKRL